jgi:hypothetical protein
MVSDRFILRILKRIEWNMESSIPNFEIFQLLHNLEITQVRRLNYQTFWFAVTIVSAFNFESSPMPTYSVR